jgi:hypothetical protein
MSRSGLETRGYSNEIIKRWQAGTVRVIVDPRANSTTR